MATSIRSEREVWRCEIHNDTGTVAGIEMVIMAAPVWPSCFYLLAHRRKTR